MSKKSYSQYNQDTHVISFFEEMSDGYFVDIGAFDGISLSNSYKLETEFNWKGICVEPQEDQFEKLRDSRSAICVKKALSDTSGETLAFSKGLLDGWGKNAALRGDQVEVESATLTELLDQHNAPAFIQYMTLDTEGSELEILQGVNFDRYTFGYLCVEHNHVVEKRSRIRALLEQNGYLFHKENHCDDDYYHRSMIGGTYYFNNDYTRPIDVTLSGDNDILVVSDYWPDQKGRFFPETLQIEFEEMGKRRVTANAIIRSARNVWRKKS